MDFRVFRDYVDQQGKNVIHSWLQSLSAKQRAKITSRLRHLQTVAAPDPKQLKALDGECDGLFELVFKFDNVQVRPLCAYGPGPRQMTILFVAEERNGRWVPPEACRIAHRLMEFVRKGQDRSVEHDFS